jgi:hypothetical protein
VVAFEIRLQSLRKTTQLSDYGAPEADFNVSYFRRSKSAQRTCVTFGKEANIDLITALETKMKKV